MRTREFPVEPRLIRYADLVSMTGLDCPPAAGAPAEYFILLENGACEPSTLDTHIAVPHGFTLKAERRVERGGRAGHESPTAEVLIVHAGRWRLTVGPDEDFSTDLVPGDVASIPPDVFRRWERLEGEGGFLFIVQGLKAGTGADDRTAVFESVGDERRSVRDGHFIDYSSGIPRMRDVGGGRDQSAIQGDAWAPYRVNAGQLAPCEFSALSVRGVAEAGIISPAGTRDGFAQGAIGTRWPHGFNLRSLMLHSGAYVPRHRRAESEVVLIQSGTLEVSWAEGAAMLGAGDVLSMPAGAPHALRNTTSKPVEAFIVRGSDDPAMPQFDSMPTLEIFKSAYPSAG
jgi:quercetin dioxygenase-like cupin family protein